MSSDHKLFFDELIRGKSTRTKNSLELLDRTLKKYHDANGKNYSISNVARLSKENGGVGEVSIRNTSGEHYRQLIEFWKSKAKISINSPKSEKKRFKPTGDNQLLDSIEDPVLRVLFAQIIAERNALRKENRILKKNMNLTIDMRTENRLQKQLQEDRLLPSELKALEGAISRRFFQDNNWEIEDETGRVYDQEGRPLYGCGYIQAMKKVISSSTGKIQEKEVVVEGHFTGQKLRV